MRRPGVTVYSPYPRRILPFADVTTKGALSPQLFKDPECWPGRSQTHNLLHGSPVLNQLSHWVSRADCNLSNTQNLNICSAGESVAFLMTL